MVAENVLFDKQQATNDNSNDSLPCCPTKHNPRNRDNGRVVPQTNQQPTFRLTNDNKDSL
jgi:hypothetical protein